MTEHTPGPWITTDRMRDPGCILIHTPDGESIASVWNLRRRNGDDPNTPMESNALLITAAPDMLTVLELIIELFDKCQSWELPLELLQTININVRDVVKKAKGTPTA
jgi:hypothetical protein